MGLEFSTHRDAAAHRSQGRGKGFPAKPSGYLGRVEGRHPSIVASLPLQVTCSPRERPSHRPTPEFKIKTKSYRRESILNSSPNAGPKRTPEPPGSVEGQGVFPCRECERYQPCPWMRSHHLPSSPPLLPSGDPPSLCSDLCPLVTPQGVRQDQESKCPHEAPPASGPCGAHRQGEVACEALPAEGGRGGGGGDRG